MKTTKEGEPFLSPERWQEMADWHDGSWWPEWLGWLDRHSSGEVEARTVGGRRKPYRPLHDAPGTYVYQR